MRRARVVHNLLWCGACLLTGSVALAQPAATPAASPPAAAPADAPAAAPAAPPPPPADPKGVAPSQGQPGFSEYDQGLKTADPVAAMGLFERASKAAGGNCPCLFNAGVMAERANKADDALRFYNQALAEKADCGPALINIVITGVRNGRPNDGAAAVQKGTAGNVTDPLAWVAAGTLALANNKPADAEANAKKALKMDEKNVEAMRLLAHVYFASKRYELSAFVLKRAADIDPGNALIQQDLGLTNLEMKPERRFRAEAKLAFERAVATRQDLPESYNNLAVLYGEGGDHETAAQMAAKVVELRPKLAKGWLNHGNALRAVKKYKEALEAYNKVVELDPSLTQVLYNLGIMHLDNEIPNLDEADRLAQASKYLADYLAKEKDISADDKSKVEQYVREADRTRDRLVKKRAKDKKKAEKDAEKKAKEEAAAKQKEADEAQKAKDEAAAKKKAEDDAAQKAKDEAAAKKKADDDAALKAKDDAAAKKRADDEAAAKKKAEDEAAAKKKADDEAALKAKQDAAKPKEKGLKKAADPEPPPSEPAKPKEKGLKKAEPEPAPAEEPPPPANKKGKKEKGLKKSAPEDAPPQDTPPPQPKKLGKGK